MDGHYCSAVTESDVIEAMEQGIALSPCDAGDGPANTPASSVNGGTNDTEDDHKEDPSEISWHETK